MNVDVNTNHATIFNVNDIANALDVNPETVRRWIRSGKLKAEQHSKKEGNVITMEAFMDFLNTPKYAERSSRTYAEAHMKQRGDKNMATMNNCCIPYPAKNDKYDDLINEFPQLLTEEALNIIRKQYYDALSYLCHEEDPYKKIGHAIFAANLYDLIGVIEFKLVNKGIEFYKSKNKENI